MKFEFILNVLHYCTKTGGYILLAPSSVVLFWYRAFILHGESINPEKCHQYVTYNPREGNK